MYNNECNWLLNKYVKWSLGCAGDGILPLIPTGSLGLEWLIPGGYCPVRFAGWLSWRYDGQNDICQTLKVAALTK